MRIIPEITADCQPTWQTELQNAITDPAELLERLGLSLDLLPAAYKASQSFPLKVPLPFISRITPGDPEDPLLRQILPISAELDTHEGFSVDPLQEKEANQRPGLLHKYKSRVLLIATGTCAVNCRYCFRRHFPYEENNPGRLGWQQSLHYIAADTNIQEVILSGGDPLMLTDASLARFIQQLSAINHVKIVRFHTRLPIVIPQRITESLLAALTQTRLKIVMVLHCNHAQEIDNQVSMAAKKITQAGITLLNQAVLLRGVNDAVSTLTTLSQQLFANHILPYYLHLCDRVAGAAHFFVPEEEAKTLYRKLQAELPGYLVPRLVKEEPGAEAKMVIL